MLAPITPPIHTHTHLYTTHTASAVEQSAAVWFTWTQNLCYAWGIPFPKIPYMDNIVAYASAFKVLALHFADVYKPGLRLTQSLPYQLPPPMSSCQRHFYFIHFSSCGPPAFVLLCRSHTETHIANIHNKWNHCTHMVGADTNNYRHQTANTTTCTHLLWWSVPVALDHKVWKTIIIKTSQWSVILRSVVKYHTIGSGCWSAYCIISTYLC